MTRTIRIADSKGRVILPGFANATVVIEAINKSEYRVRKAQVIPEDELQFPEEENPVPLSEADARRLLETLEDPPKPKAAAKRAAKRFQKHYG